MDLFGGPAHLGGHVPPLLDEAVVDRSTGFERVHGVSALPGEGDRPLPAGPEDRESTGPHRQPLNWLATEKGCRAILPAVITDAQWLRIRRGLRHGQPLTGTVVRVPNPGAIGIFVDVGLAVGGFVDVVLLPRTDARRWPAEGTITQFEVWAADARKQLRLKPADPAFLSEDFDDFVTRFRPDWPARIGTPLVRTYPYTGPADLADGTGPGGRGCAVASAADFEAWAAGRAPGEWDEPFTYVVGTDGLLRLAPRRSEHVACAGGASVLAAGEMAFGRTGSGGGRWAVTEVSNLSTGYCPDLYSWQAVGEALDRAGFERRDRPDDFTHPIVFRRCVSCRERNVVRDDFFVCAVCGADLPAVWNVNDGGDAGEAGTAL